MLEPVDERGNFTKQLLVVYGGVTIAIWAFGELQWWWWRSRWRARAAVPLGVWRLLSYPPAAADHGVRRRR